MLYPGLDGQRVGKNHHLEGVEKGGVLKHRAGKLLEQPIREVVSRWEEPLHKSDVTAVGGCHDGHVVGLAGFYSRDAVSRLKYERFFVFGFSD